MEKNISLNYCLHHVISHYKKMIKTHNLKLNYITDEQISDTLMKSSLLITDFSSVVFDFVYQRKPIINNYIDLINSIRNGTIHLENKYNTTEQVINKIIYYIDKNFQLESNIIEFYNSFELKCGNNTQAFIDYVENMK